ncbi:MAG: hypothetical protein P1T08_08085 [Acidimicrobiia bacterium]|nr:hypothetical protein [Acidimicrobiia bacterium]
MGWFTHLLGVGAVYAAALPQFGGEDPLGAAPGPDNWHHEGLTRMAARGSGWSEEAENALAFHADYVDSYLYNPLWWFDLANGGGPGRLPVVMSSQSELIKVHFDDLFHPESVRAMWRRYLSGTAAALIWLGHASSAPREQRIRMAHNAVGVSLHAMQDFYSHSNWIDDKRLRNCTWFEVDPADRAKLSLWTGSYELPHHLGIKPHGAFLFACTILNRIGPVGRRLMSVICHAASPVSQGSLCRWFKQCQEAVPLTPPDVGGIDLPDDILWVEPGINVDSHWQAELGVDVRGLEITGREAFDIAYELAYRTSCQWLHTLDHVMDEAGLQDFWQQVKTEGVSRANYKTPTDPWEDFAQIPYRFVTAGSYPPVQGHDDTEDWYLRLQIRTANTGNAGTDADIVPFVNGVRYPILDHGVPPSGGASSRSLFQTLLGHNDFERGDTAAYVIGPIDGIPNTVTLLNDAPNVGDVILAALEGLWDTVVGVLESVVDFFKGIWGYDADFVDKDHQMISAATLNALGPGGRHNFSLRCDGGSEGDYRIYGHVDATSTTGTFGNGVPWREYRVHFRQLHCIEESDWDRFSNSDEPFVLGLVIPHGGTQPMISWRTGPFSDVDSGEDRSINRTFTVRVPQRYGFISVAVAVYEHDDESSGDRDELLRDFAGNVGAGIVDAEDTFFETLGESIAAGWKLHSVEATAFRRSERVEVREFDSRTFDRWVDGGDRVDWRLQGGRTWRADVPDTNRCGCEEPGVEFELPNLDVEIPRLDFGPKVEQNREAVKDDGAVFELDLAAVAIKLSPRFEVGIDIVDEVRVPELPGREDIDCGPGGHHSESKDNDSKEKGERSAK